MATTDKIRSGKDVYAYLQHVDPVKLKPYLKQLGQLAITSSTTPAVPPARKPHRV
jgi:hypothetical protein